MGYHRKKDYVCIECGKDFDTWRQVKDHMIKTHNVLLTKSDEEFYRRK